MILTPMTDAIPFAVRHEWLRHEIAHERLIVLTILHERRPHVSVAERVHVEQLAQNLLRVTARYGFMQNPRIAQILALARKRAPRDAFENPIYYFLARPRVVTDPRPGAMRPWRRALYTTMLQTARPFTDSLGLPPDRIVEFGVSIPV
ncbi:MAG: hypothetical protein ABR591_08620 [Candidatus Velthaea sp.]